MTTINRAVSHTVMVSSSGAWGWSCSCGDERRGYLTEDACRSAGSAHQREGTHLHDDWRLMRTVGELEKLDEKIAADQARRERLVERRDELMAARSRRFAAHLTPPPEEGSLDEFERSS